MFVKSCLLPRAAPVPHVGVRVARERQRDNDRENNDRERMTPKRTTVNGDGVSGDHAGRAGPPAGLRCLVTNDDGIGSEGLRALALVALEAGLEVVVAGPMEDVSGASASNPAGYAAMLWFFGVLSLVGFVFTLFLWRLERREARA